ncbi:hypothetical protein KIN20_020948 [Parelaphostrongylus tenuis]|uniref:Uncharacterized protein n=1 Tax=Parelaphostrongylus tenuis TaxID=148309 RepID=A0AAD5N6K2_PARTN|nr:hypothetical protein KIN20_020948 [Parelaphostrongylus tenuis]
MGDRLMRSIEDSVMASGVIVADGDDVILVMSKNTIKSRIFFETWAGTLREPLCGARRPK